MNTIQDSPLGKKSLCPLNYNSELLYPIPRKQNRLAIGIDQPLPFYGFDVWQDYEISWLNLNGRPNVAIGQFIFPCSTPYLIESKSLKLYLHSLNNRKFVHSDDVRSLISADLSYYTGENVVVHLTPLHLTEPTLLSAKLPGTYLDELDILITDDHVNPLLLTVESSHADETLYSHLLKSNCPVTNQPDWATLVINYTGNKINAENLLKYIVSFRNHADFAENCVERIFMDIQQQCAPNELTVSAFYTRRGGKDINPIRSTNNKITPNFMRILRQ